MGKCKNCKCWFTDEREVKTPDGIYRLCVLELENGKNSPWIDGDDTEGNCILYPENYGCIYFEQQKEADRL